jgi:hypothetical protein
MPVFWLNHWGAANISVIAIRAPAKAKRDKYLMSDKVMEYKVDLGG